MSSFQDKIGEQLRRRAAVPGFCPHQWVAWGPATGLVMCWLQESVTSRSKKAGSDRANQRVPDLCERMNFTIVSAATTRGLNPDQGRPASNFAGRGSETG